MIGSGAFERHSIDSSSLVLTQNLVAQLNRLATVRCYPLQWFGATASLRVGGLLSGVPDFEVLVRVSGYGSCWIAGFSIVAAQRLIASTTERIAWNSLPRQAKLSLLQTAVDSLRTISANGAVPPLLIEDFVDPTELRNTHRAVEIQIRPQTTQESGDVIEPISLFWVCDVAALADPARTISQHETPFLPHSTRFSAVDRWSFLPIPVFFELGYVILPLKELREVVIGDVILADQLWAEADYERVAIRIGAGAGARLGVFDKNANSVVVGGDFTMESNPDGAMDILPIGELDDLPVKLTFDLGERVMRLAELAEIGAGYVFDLGVPNQSCVRVRANGVQIGEGMLVEIDGKRGVAITRIAPPAQ